MIVCSLHPQGEQGSRPSYRVGDVGFERRCTAFVDCHELAVDPDLGTAIDALEGAASRRPLPAGVVNAADNRRRLNRRETLPSPNGRAR